MGGGHEGRRSRRYADCQVLSRAVVLDQRIEGAGHRLGRLVCPDQLIGFGLPAIEPDRHGAGDGVDAAAA